MTDSVILSRLRRFLLALATVLCIGTVAELALEEHFQDAIQYVPFVLCALGLAALVLAQVRPMRRTILALQAVMVLLALGGALGVYEHLVHNIAFELDIRPNAGMSDVILDALMGASPLLAPGALTVVAAVAAAATYRHPGLSTD